jgi:hypothetical protein
VIAWSSICSCSHQNARNPRIYSNPVLSKHSVGSIVSGCQHRRGSQVVCASRRPDLPRNVTAIGKLYYGETGYYSAKLAMSIESLRPGASCRPRPLEPDPAKANVPADLRSYQASITVDYRGKGRVTVEVWTDEKRRVSLKPWQAYVDYRLNGAADVVYFGCREGFEWRDANQVPKSSRGVSNGSDSNRASALLNDSVSPNVVTFTCEQAKASPLKR